MSESLGTNSTDAVGPDAMLSLSLYMALSPLQGHSFNCYLLCASHRVNAELAKLTEHRVLFSSTSYVTIARIW